MKTLLKFSAMLSLCVAFTLVARSQEKRTQSSDTGVSNQDDKALMEIIIPLKNVNAYYCRGSWDFNPWLPEFREQVEAKLIPLLSKDGEFEFILEKHTVRVLIPRKNVEAVRRFFAEQEKSKPEASEEDRKKGITTICP